jgi:hypothetical protein
MTAAAIGAGVTLAAVAWLAIRYAPTVARFLLSVAAARAAFRATWRSGQAPGNGLVLIGKARTGQPLLNVVQTETIEALAGLGMNRKTAEARVRQEGTAADVETLLKRCMVKAA